MTEAMNPDFETVVRSSLDRQGSMVHRGARVSLVEPG